MRTLLVLRHAKSSWKHTGLSDFERPLNKRGRRAAPFMGRTLKAKRLLPSLVICSPAQRAKMTAELVIGAAGLDCDLRFDERIYGAGANSLIDIICGIEDSVGVAMIVGHNPGFEYLVGTLCGETPRMPTAAVAVIDLEVSNWSETAPGLGRLRHLLRPKELGAD